MNFFVYWDNLEPGSGYELFGAGHIAIMAVCALFIALSALWYASHKASPAARLFKKITALSLIILIILRVIYVCAVGANVVYDLPLHLCSIAGFVCFIYEFTYDRMNRFIKDLLSQVLYALCLPGAVLAIIFSDGTAYPVIHFITIQSNLFHALIVMYVLLRLIDKDVVPSVRKAPLNFLFLIFTAGPVYLFDRHFRANYMFLLNPSKGSPLESIYTSHGYAAYLLVYGLLVILEVFLINLIGEPLRRSGSRQDIS